MHCRIHPQGDRRARPTRPNLSRHPTLRMTDRGPNHVRGCRAAPSPRRRRPGVRHHRFPILVPPPAFYSQIPFPTEYPDGFTTFTPSIATTPCPHTFVIAPLSRPVEVCAECPALAGVRNLGPDDPSPGRPDSPCNFGRIRRSLANHAEYGTRNREIEIWHVFGRGCAQGHHAVLLSMTSSDVDDDLITRALQEATPFCP